MHKIDLTKIIQIAAVIGGVILWYATIESRLAVAETKITSIEVSISDFKDYLIRIENKVDKLK